MPLFEKKYVQYLTTYKVPIGPNQLDPNVFYVPDNGEQPMLQQSIHSQIVKDLEAFVGGYPERIKDCYLVGQACKPGSKNRNAELRVIVVLDKNLKDLDVDGLLAERILKLAKELSGKMAIGTGRKINYVVTVRPIEDSSYEGIYDINKIRWHKLPGGVSKYA